MLRFFNAFYGWNLINLNAERNNFPAADLGDRDRRIAVQITNEGESAKITKTRVMAEAHRLGTDYSRLIIFFLLEKKPPFPKSFVQPLTGPTIDCIDITDLLKDAQQTSDFDALKRTASVLEEEMDIEIPASPIQRYFTALRDHFSTYENLGLPLPANAEGEKDVPLSIRDLFVIPTCTHERMSPEGLDAALLTGKNPAIPLLHVLAGSHRRIVVLGDPGMGKSTLIQWLITSLAEEAPLPEEATNLRGAIPLPFILRDLVGHLPGNPAKWDWPALLHAFSEYHPRSSERSPLAVALTSDKAAFRTLLASERAFFLIDGIDELGDTKHRQAMRAALWQGFEQYPTARWLITSRWIGYEEAKVDLEVKKELIWPGMPGKPDDPEVVRELKARDQYPATFDTSKPQYATITTFRAQLLYLAPFDDEQQHTFAYHWYLPRMGEVLGTEHAGRFIEAIRRHHSIRVIGRVPNLLYLLALLYRHRAQHLRCLPHRNCSRKFGQLLTP